MKQEIIKTYLDLKDKFGLNASRSFSGKKYKHLKDELIRITSFLDTKDGLSKRVYCIMNNITEKPKCKCGTLIKTWRWSDGFKKMCNQCASRNPNRKIKTQNTCLRRYGATTNLQIKEVNEKRLKAHKSKEFSNKMKQQWMNYSELDLRNRKQKIETTNIMKYGAKNPFSKSSSLFSKVQTNNKKAIQEKYGVDNVWSVPEISMKGRLTRIAMGLERHPSQKKDVENYYSKVWEITNKNFKDNYYDITNNETILRSKEYHLDHIYSIHYGFVNNILPAIIGHRNNLRLIPASENTSKNKRCDITIDEILKG